MFVSETKFLSEATKHNLILPKQSHLMGQSPSVETFSLQLGTHVFDWNKICDITTVDHTNIIYRRQYVAQKD